MDVQRPSKPRCAVLVGPYMAGKTSLLEALLHGAGALARKGSVADGTSLGDGAPDARARRMTIEPNLASCTYLGEAWSFIDCPGSVELGADAQAALMVADVAIVVAEPDPDRAVTLAPLLKFLELRDIPHILFVNKMDRATARIRDILAALQQVSAKPLVLRQVPIREGETVAGYVDLVSERAYRYRENHSSDLVAMPETVRDRENEARAGLIEALADFDDAILEQVLEDKVPPPAEIYEQLAHDLRRDVIAPVFFGSAEHGNGVVRLLKALRHEAPGVEAAARRLGIEPGEELALVAFKTLHQPHTGKLSYTRILSGTLNEATAPGGKRLGGLFRIMGAEAHRLPQGVAGDIVAIGRLDEIATGTILGPDGLSRPAGGWPSEPTPVFARALTARDRKDEVKLMGALGRLIEEDPGLSLAHEAATGQMLLRGQGEIHLQIAAERLRSRFNLEVQLAPPATSYRETIRRGTRQHARFKRQSGGHGQFADVHVEIEPLPRGAGFEFRNRVVGGTVPKNFIPAVEAGARDALAKGPLGFPLVDLAVALTDGQFHSVDSSDQAFRTVAQMAMAEGLAKCEPVLLEPIAQVVLAIPNHFTAKVHAIVSGRRGQILGLSAREGWPGWDELTCNLPEAELHDLVTELRSATLGVGSFSARFDHLHELTGKLADRVIEDRRRRMAA